MEKLRLWFPSELPCEHGWRIVGFETLLDRRADIEQKNTMIGRTNRPILTAAAGLGGFCATVDVNTKDSFGQEAPLHCCFEGKVEVAKWLL
jgi:hypothetical protein